MSNSMLKPFLVTSPAQSTFSPGSTLPAVTAPLPVGTVIWGNQRNRGSVCLLFDHGELDAKVKV